MGDGTELPASPAASRSRARRVPPARSCARCSIWLCRRCAPPAAPRSNGQGCARHAGRSFRSSPRPIASASAFRSSTTRARASCPWRPSPTRRPMGGPAPRCAMTKSPAPLYTRSNMATGSTSRHHGPLDGRAGRELLAEADALVPVPLHWRRIWARRFNQSAVLAPAISAHGRRAGRRRRAQARAGHRRSRSG